MRSLYDQPSLYDAQYLRYRDDIPHYLRLAEDAGGPVLELGAGTARMTSALARAGFEVVGVESSGEMLARGRERLLSEGVEERAQLLQGDMRTLRLERRFPLVIAPFNALMHLYTLEDQDATLRAVEGHLEASGTFGFDLFTPRFGQLGVLRREAEWEGVGGEDADLFLLQEHDPVRQMIVSRYYLDRVDDEGRLERRRAVLRQRYYHRFEIERALRGAGLTRLSLRGGFDGRPFEEGSAYLVGTARR